MITNSEEYDDDDDDPYGGIDDDEDDTEVGQVLFRGSQSFSGPSIQIAAPASPPRRVAIPQVVSRTEPKPDTEILVSSILSSSSFASQVLNESVLFSPSSRSSTTTFLTATTSSSRGLQSTPLE